MTNLERQKMQAILQGMREAAEVIEQQIAASDRDKLDPIQAFRRGKVVAIKDMADLVRRYL